MIGILIGWLNPIGRITKQIADAYVKKQDAQTERERIEAEAQIAQLEARQQVLVAEQQHPITRLVGERDTGNLVVQKLCVLRRLQGQNADHYRNG